MRLAPAFPRFAPPSPQTGRRDQAILMQRYAFKMFLNPGEAYEYRRRHEAIWPELKALIREKGIRNYSIHLDPETNLLFAYLERTDDHRMDELTKEPVMRRWWEFMKDIMAANPDGSPVTATLVEMFHAQ
jgi:L-rhamnose mutarotase